MFEASSTSFHLQVVGGDSRDRTGDLLLARQALSQLSYIPVLSTSLSSFRRRCGVQAFRLRNLDRRANSLRPRIFISSKGSHKSIAFTGMVGPSGLEPPTLRLSVVRSSQLSYGPILVADFVSLNPTQARGFVHSVAPPLPRRPASPGSARRGTRVTLRTLRVPSKLNNEALSALTLGRYKQVSHCLRSP